MIIKNEFNSQSQILCQELNELQDLINDYLNSDCNKIRSDRLIKQYENKIDSLRHLSVSYGFSFIKPICLFVKRNLILTKESKAILGLPLLRLLVEWPHILTLVINQPEVAENAQKLLQTLANSGWARKIEKSHNNMLENRLSGYVCEMNAVANGESAFNTSNLVTLQHADVFEQVATLGEEKPLKYNNNEVTSEVEIYSKPNRHESDCVENLAEPVESKNVECFSSDKIDDELLSESVFDEFSFDFEDEEENSKGDSDITLESLMEFDIEDETNNELSELSKSNRFSEEDKISRIDNIAHEEKDFEPPHDLAKDVKENLDSIEKENRIDSFGTKALEEELNIESDSDEPFEFKDSFINYRKSAKPQLETLCSNLEKAVEEGKFEDQKVFLEQGVFNLSQLADNTISLDLAGSAWFFKKLNVWLQSVTADMKGMALLLVHRKIIQNYIDYLFDANDDTLFEFLGLLISNQFCELSESEIENSAEMFCLELAFVVERKSDAQEQHKSVDIHDVDLTIPEDAQSVLVDMFLQEAPQHIEELTESLQKFSQSAGEINYLKSAQRSVHTLKGAAGTVGILGIVNLTHQFEDILGYLAEESGELAKPVINYIFRVADSLADSCEYLLGNSERPDDLLVIYQSLVEITLGHSKGLSVTQLAQQLQLDHEEGLDDQFGRSVVDDEFPSIQAESKEEEILSELTSDGKTSFEKDEGADNISNSIATKNRKLPLDTHSVEENSSSNTTKSAMIRVAKDDLEKLLRNVGESTVLQGQLDDEYGHVKGMVSDLDELAEKMQKTVYEFESYVDIRAVSDSERKQSRSATEKGEFDPLEVNRMNELHTYLNQIIESISDIKQVEDSLKSRLGSLDSIFQKQSDLGKNMETDVLSTRMVPVKTTVPRLERCVRQVSRLLNKDVNLSISGKSINIDVDVLNMLVDPLMHILRNAVDHGIEEKSQRKISGKCETGNIELTFKQQGHSIIVSCKDDGKGIDYEKIKLRLQEEGIITKQQSLSETALYQYILQAGFSTKDKVTATSGRGVGMDVVSQKVSEFGGYLEIQSAKNSGCEIKMTLPITMVSQHVLIVRTSRTLYALPTNSLLQIFAPQSGDFKTIGKRLNFYFGGENYPSHYSGNYLADSSGELNQNELQKKPGVIVRTDSGAKAIFFDEVLDCRDIVLKKFGKHLPHLKGVHGAATLGDGQIVAVLEVNELVQKQANNYFDRHSNHLQKTNSEQLNNRVLVVEDSLSTRRTLEQLVADSGYDVKTAIDGIEAIQIMKNWKPNVILSDLELPRLNGLELTTHVRTSKELEDIPVIMITSRYTKKHREHAQKVGVSVYLTKPFSEIDVMSNIENMTRETA